MPIEVIVENGALHDVKEIRILFKNCLSFTVQEKIVPHI